LVGEVGLEPTKA